MKSIKLALPKGQLQNRTSLLLEEAGLSVDEYQGGSRCYRPGCETYPDLFLKVFQEKDIAIQVAIGNYDLGICRSDWVDELLAKFPSDAIVKLKDLGYGKRNLCVAAGDSYDNSSIEYFLRNTNGVRIVSEYPNLAQSFALRNRLKRFRIFPIWGSAESYPPENAELAMITTTSIDDLRSRNMVPVASMLESSAYLIANRESLQKRDLGKIVQALYQVEVHENEAQTCDDRLPLEKKQTKSLQPLISIALPDGHQQKHTVALLNRAGLEIDGYTTGTPSVRPNIGIDGIAVKVVRPQDMPLQVANGNFDVAITGRDWLHHHRYRFPASPVEELLDLGFGKVRIVVVVHQDMPVDSTDDLRNITKVTALRVASEYINIADKYARDHHLAPCKIIPTWGASEAFLPEDADVLIENTETGSTIAKNNLKIIETLFESTGCVIVNMESMAIPAKQELINNLVNILRRGIE